MTDIIERLREYVGWRSFAYRSERDNENRPLPDDVILASDAAFEFEKQRARIAALERERDELKAALEKISGPWGYLSEEGHDHCLTIARRALSSGRVG